MKFKNYKILTFSIIKAAVSAAFFFSSPSLVFGSDSTIDEGGLYISDDRVNVSAGAYILSGSFELIGEGEGMLSLGLGIYDKSGNALHGHDYFVADGGEGGLFEVASLILKENAETPFSTRIMLEGADIAVVAFALEVYLPQGAVLNIKSLNLIAEKSDENSDSGSDSSNGSKNNGDGSLSGANVSVGGSIGGSSSGTVSATEAESKNVSFQKTISGMTIYLHAVSGSDSNSGVAQNLPRKTISSSVNMTNVGELVLMESDGVFVTDLIKPESGKTIVIRPQGTASIKGVSTSYGKGRNKESHRNIR